MESEPVAGMHLFYDAEEQAAARIIAIACERSVRLLRQRWGLAVPEDCRVYVMTSWLGFLFHSAPWHWKAYLALTLPLVARRASHIWPYAGGWSLPFGRRRAVGVKPMRLIQTANRGLGEQIFTKNRDLSETVQTVTCHELVHAFTFHLRLPTWLNEGLATLAMEHYLDRRIVREETLENLLHASLTPTSSATEKLRMDDPQALISQYVRSYWLTRYIEETRPELLKDLLSMRYKKKELEDKVVSAFGKDQKNIWGFVYNEFRSE
jgi:hypothetical protein